MRTVLQLHCNAVSSAIENYFQFYRTTTITTSWLLEFVMPDMPVLETFEKTSIPSSILESKGTRDRLAKTTVHRKYDCNLALFAEMVELQLAIQGHASTGLSPLLVWFR